MKTVTFENGDKMPVLGLGTYKSPEEDVKNAVKKAIEIGYRAIDCAYIYDNENSIGEELNKCFEIGLVKREELFITSKLWNSDHSPKDVEKAIKKSLYDLRLDYLDLYLIHWPIAQKHGIERPKQASDYYTLEQCPLEYTWSAMVDMKKKGLCKHIGVSNFSSKKIEHITDRTGVKPEMVQVEMHPYFQQNDLLQYCKKEEIFITAYSPFGRDRTINNKKGVLHEPLILEIAQSHNCSPAQVILAWGIERGFIVIPKSIHSDRLKENFDSLKVKLTPEDMNRIALLDADLRFTDGTSWIVDGGPYTVRNIWDEEDI